MSRTSKRTARLATGLVAGILALATLGFAAPAAAADVATSVRLFGADERANPDISIFNKWTAVLARYEREKALEDRPCGAGACAVQQWARFVAGLRGHDPLAQLEAVNAYVNRAPYQPDDSRYGMVDYWATPREFLGRGGDCEDYAFAKYLSLRKLGWAADQLRVVVLMHHQRRELHAVLVAYHGGTAYVLDNLLGGVVEHRALPHYQPIYSINEKAWFHHHGWSLAARDRYSALPPAGDGATLVAAPAERAPRVAFRTAPFPPARSFAGNAAESTAALFAGPGALR